MLTRESRIKCGFHLLYWVWDDNVLIVSYRMCVFSEFQNPRSYLEVLTCFIPKSYSGSKLVFFKGLTGDQSRGL